MRPFVKPVTMPYRGDLLAPCGPAGAKKTEWAVDRELKSQVTFQRDARTFLVQESYSYALLCFEVRSARTLGVYLSFS